MYLTSTPGPSSSQQPLSTRIRQQVYVSLPPRGTFSTHRHGPTRLSGSIHRPQDNDVGTDNDTPAASVIYIRSRKRYRSPSTSESSFSDSMSLSTGSEMPSEDDFNPGKCSHKRTKFTHAHTQKRHPDASLTPDPDPQAHAASSSGEQGQSANSSASPQRSGAAGHTKDARKGEKCPLPPQLPKSQVPATSAVANDRIRIIGNGLFFTYMFEGAHCQHALGPTSPSSVPSSDSWPPILEGPVVSEEHMDKRCAGLNALTISMVPPLNAFFCRLHCRFILPAEIKSHIRKVHRKTLLSSTKNNTNFMAHIEQLYPAISTSGPTPTTKRHILISTPIPFLPEPGWIAFCPSDPCPSVFKWDNTTPGTVSKPYSFHMKASPRCAAAQSFIVLDNKKIVKPTLRYAQLAGNHTSIQWVFYLPEDWLPSSHGKGHSSSVQTGRPDPEAAQAADVGLDQPYVTELGWDKAFPASDIMAFKTLLKPPNRSDASDSETAESIALEHGMLESKDFLYHYLEGANQFVEDKSRSVRDAITKGSKSRFRKLTPGTLKCYRKPLVHVISFLIWFNFHCKLKKKILDGFNPGLTKRIKCAVRNLYTFLTSPSVPEVSRYHSLGVHIHCLLTALLTGQSSSHRKIDGPFDYVLILAMYIGNGNFREPIEISRYCAMDQYCMRVIIVHATRLGGLDANYTPLQNPDAVEEDGQEEDDREETDELEDNPIFPLDMLPLPEGYELVNLPDFDGVSIEAGQAMIENPLMLDDNEYDASESIDPLQSIPVTTSSNFVDPMEIHDIDDEESSTDNLNHLLQDDLLTVLADLHKWIHHEPAIGAQPTAFQRMKSVWQVVWPLAINAISKTQTQWDSEGHVLTFSDSSCPPHQLQLKDLATFARSLVAEAQERLEKLIPSLFNSIDLSSLKDTPATRCSLFDQNRAIFQPLIDDAFQSIKSQLARTSGAQQKYRMRQLTAWFGKEQELLESILLSYFFTSGIPPREFQAAALQFKSSRNQKRNVFVMKGRLVFGWPKSKTFHRATQAALWSLPPVLGKVVTLLVAFRITKEAGLNPCADSRYMLFAKTKPVHTQIGSWPTRRMSKVFKRTVEPMGLYLGPQRLRQIMTAIFKKHLPGVIEPTRGPLYRVGHQISYANRQADHAQRTSNLHYGISLGPSSSLNLSDADVDQFIEVSEALQAVFALIPGSRAILDQFYEAAPLRKSAHMDLAYERVRVLLCRKYKFGGESSRATANSLLSCQPFMPSLHKSSLGDSTLWEIASVIIFGRGSPSATDAVPLSGYSPEVITEAIILIMLGIEEWANEAAVEYSLQHPAVDVAMNSMRARLRSQIERLEKGSPEKWQELGVLIFRQASARSQAPKMMAVKPLADIVVKDMDVD